MRIANQSSDMAEGEREVMTTMATNRGTGQTQGARCTQGVAPGSLTDQVVKEVGAWVIPD